MLVKLPNGDRADLGRKLEDYVLSTLHREGRNKARVFESVLGVSLTNRDLLRESILRAAATSDEVEGHGDNGHGMVYSLRFPMRSPKGAATVVTRGSFGEARTFRASRPARFSRL